MMGDVKGLITITDYLIMFDPLDCPENEVNDIASALSKFHLCIDVHDVVHCQQLSLPNKMAADFQELALQQAYKFDYYLNFTVSTVNGKLTRRSKSVRRENETLEVERDDPIASVFFRFSHRNRQGQILLNSKQKVIVQRLCKRVNQFLVQSKRTRSKFSTTLIPFYDPYIPDSNLAVQFAPCLEDYKRHIQFFNGVMPDKDISEQVRRRVTCSIPHIDPEVLKISKILKPETLLQIALNLPPLTRLKNWILLYSKERDGTSFGTFYRLVEGEDVTLIVVEDSKGGVFGAYCAGGQWSVQPYFFGNGQTFLFKFNEEMHIKVFRWVGGNQFFRNANKKSIGLGGSSANLKHVDHHKMGFGLQISDGFAVGRSTKSQTFDNQPLSSEQLFDIKRFQVWGYKLYL